MSENSESFLFRISTPKFEDLYCTVCEIDRLEVLDSPAESNFHWQTMKCRLLIFLLPEIIAAPILGTGTSISIIMKRDLFMSGKFEEFLRKLKLAYQGVRSITLDIYTQCLAYTIQCKISPEWNKVGQYFLFGQEFYSAVQGTDAVELEVQADDKETYLELRAKRIHIRHLRLEDLHLPLDLIAGFMADAQGYLKMPENQSPWLHILPSLKKGKILFITKDIPDQCPFRSYNEIRRHWRNMYGYTLPMTQGNIFFCVVKFPVPRSTLFTYPNLCLTTSPLDVRSNRDPKKVIKQFLTDLANSVKSICQVKVEIVRTGNQTKEEIMKREDIMKEEEQQENRDVNSTQKKIEFSSKYVANCSLTEQLTNIRRIHHSNPPGTSGKVSTSLANTDEERSSYFENETPESFSQNCEKRLTLRQKLSTGRSSKNVEEIDMGSLARENRLGELTTTQLSNWLKKNSVSCNSKCKKSDLIYKVLSQLRNSRLR